MDYSLFNSGKRFRPILLLTILEALEVPIENGLDVACAIEMIHTYSLIHDDLPAMDDDDYRRGQLTNHKVYGEGMAILAGDGLLTDSFEVILRSNLSDKQKVMLVNEFVHASGSTGMILGQVMDLEAEGKHIDLKTLRTIHELKTARLLQLSIISALIIAEKYDSIELGRTLGYDLGIAFQIKDDLLDVYGDSKELGKPTGSDIENDKSTYVSLLGREQCEQELSKHLRESYDILEKLNISTYSPLNKLVEFIGNRTK
jgi:geranylgeranyl diphosphate synthase type II